MFYIQHRNELLNLKERPCKSDKSHILSEKNHTFHMNMFLILLIYPLIDVGFFNFPGAYCRKYAVLINKIILKW